MLRLLKKSASNFRSNMISILSIILSYSSAFLLAFVAKCYDGWFIRPYFNHPEIPFLAYFGMVLLYRIISLNFSTKEYVYAKENREKIEKYNNDAIITLIICYTIALINGWIFHFFI